MGWGTVSGDGTEFEASCSSWLNGSTPSHFPELSCVILTKPHCGVAKKGCTGPSSPGCLFMAQSRRMKMRSCTPFGGGYDSFLLYRNSSKI